MHLFGLWCKVVGGGPPLTIVHVFDYPYEGEDSFVQNALQDFEEVKQVKKQAYLSNVHVYTGTRFVFCHLKFTPPRVLIINGVVCRLWYCGQSLVCNLCGRQGHKSAVCPDKDKCRRCGKTGHFARNGRDLCSLRDEGDVLASDDQGDGNLRTMDPCSSLDATLPPLGDGGVFVSGPLLSGSSDSAEVVVGVVGTSNTHDNSSSTEVVTSVSLFSKPLSEAPLPPKDSSG